MKTINNELIRSFSPCYEPSEIVTDENETLTVVEWVVKYRDKVKSKADIVWLLCRNEFMSDKELRLFAVWCAREALKLVKNPDPRSIQACNVAEKFANGESTQEELAAAWDAAWTAVRDARDNAKDAAWAARNAARNAAARNARDAAREAAVWEADAWTTDKDAAAWEAGAWEAGRDVQIDKLLTYFKEKH